MNPSEVKKVCIVTTRHISYNPRVLKEADALAAAGYAVSVVTVNNNSRQRAFDEELMRSRSWKLKTVNFRRDVGSEKIRWFFLAMGQKVFLLFSRLSLRFGTAERMVERASDALGRLAARERADLYIVHHPEALGPGAAAAGRSKAKLGYDAEDFHTGLNGMGARETAVIYYLERKYLPGCAYVSAASKGIADAYREKYGIPQPLALLNVFPREEVRVSRVNTPVRFYWYSQVIGPNRGLECLMTAAGLVSQPFEIHLRGSLHDESYRAQLQDRIARGGLKEKVFLHEPIVADRLIGEGNAYDVGLALEFNTSVNAMLCVSNKLFSYLMSGLAVIATDTDGQKEIMREVPAAGRIFRMEDAAGLAAAMTFYLEDPARLLAAKQAARVAAMEIFNWNVESGKLVSRIKTIV